MLYFRIADKYNIIDKPNERSSHSQITIRGGGIVYLLGGLVYFIYSGFLLPWFWAGFLLIALVSLADDIKTLSSRLRLPLHFIAVILLLFEGLQNNSPLWLWLVSLILATGIINAYNFMDGINGITAGYSLIVLVSLLILNREINFTSPDLIATFILADLVFGFFNFRKRAKCFAGDVGSVSIAFVIVFLLLQLMIKTQNFFYILLLAVYGVDSVMTIVYRLKKRENIFEAHRSHLYQWLVKPGPFTHLQMSGFYMLTQALVSLGVVLLYGADINIQIIYASCILIGLGVAYILIKRHYKIKYELV